jgi:hypothetical protein
MITDEEYLRERQALELNRTRLIQSRDQRGKATEWFEPARLAISFSSRAISCFKGGNTQTKRLILEIVGSNLMLDSRKLSIEARKPFRRMTGSGRDSSLCGFVEDVRTFFAENSLESAQLRAKLRLFEELTKSAMPADSVTLNMR